MLLNLINGNKKISFLEEFEDTKGVIRICKSKNDRRNRTKNLQSNTHKTKDRVTQTPLKTEGELRCSGRVSCAFSTSGTRCDYSLSSSEQCFSYVQYEQIIQMKYKISV